jgi:hypothetical protein
MRMAQRSDTDNLTALSNNISSAISNRIERTENSLFRVRLGLILVGGGLAGVAGFMPPSAADAVPWKEILGFGGSFMALVGGAIMLWVDKGSVSDLENARKALQAADSFLNQRQELLTTLASARDLDERRRHLISAQKDMLESAEQVIARANGITGQAAIENLLDTCLNGLLAAMNFRLGEQYNLSVFKVSDVNGEQRLVRLVNRCADRNDEKRTSRSWASGEGFSGAAWARSQEVILSDTASTEANEAFFVSPENVSDADTRKYRSLISLPLKVGADNAVWGVLTITSDRANRFSREPSSDASPGVEAARATGKALEILASYDHLWDKQGRVE